VVNDLVAENVMGYVQSKFKGQKGWGTLDQYTWYSHFNPAGDIQDAWVVVEKLTKDSDFELSKDCDDSFYICEFLFALNEVYLGKANSAPMAICKAALKAVGVEVPNER
jgi:hypothetical protein